MHKITNHYWSRKVTVGERLSQEPVLSGAGHQLEYKEVEGEVMVHIQDLSEQARAVVLLRR